MMRLSFIVGLLAACSVPAGIRASGGFALREGDRVVFVGNTLIEREQRYGYWEAALTRRLPGKSISFRNLGWSGDTVFGHARAGFGSPADGFKHLRDHVLALKPTVIFLAYGTNESFDGPAGLPRFLDGCKVLVDALAPTQARIVWLAPLRQEKMPPPLPLPTEHNKNLKLYSEALAEFARKNDHTFVDLFTLVGKESDANGPLTDNGIHLTAAGYRRSAFALEQGLGLAEPAWSIHVKAGGDLTLGKGVTVKMDTGASWQVTDAMLPHEKSPLPARKDEVSIARLFRIEGLMPGKHTLRIDGLAVATADAEAWAKGVNLSSGPEFEQARKLREVIVAKNLLYFHRWRPQNETYLFGFRKHEQGQNAREIPQFDPLVAQKEEEIVKLSSPRPHTYEIKPGADR